MKILKRNYGHRNLIIFLILSMIYLHSIYSLSQGRSLFTTLSFRSFFIEHYLILLVTMITWHMVMNIKKYSKYFLMFCLTLIVGKNFILLSNSFNKLTLILNFIYLLFAFYFFISWELEVSLASFNPRFSSLDLEKESRFVLKARIINESDETKSIDTVVTNLDEESCFLLLPTVDGVDLNLKKHYLLESIYEGVSFKQKARLVSSYDRGIGLMLSHGLENRFSWTELYKVCLERGILG